MAKKTRFQKAIIVLSVCVIFGLFYHTNRQEGRVTNNILRNDKNEFTFKNGSKSNSSRTCYYRKSVRNYINETSYCRKHQRDNILCATTRQIMRFKRPEYIKRLRSPCVVVEKDSRDMFNINEGYGKTKRLNVSTTINVNGRSTQRFIR